MALYKRKAIWWIDFTAPSGERVRTSTRTSDWNQAKELHDKLKAEAWRVAKLGEKPRRTWDQAALKWLEETGHKATHAEDKTKLRWLHPHLTLKPLDGITREVIAEIARAKVAESSRATANRYLALIRAILRRACYEWEWIDRVPKVTLYPEAKRRVRWITPEQARRLVAELPAHQRLIVLFALATGLRQSNVLGLRWDQVDLTRKVAWIHPDEAKARQGIGVPLNAVAMSVLERCRGQHPDYVFTYNGKPVSSANTRAWRSALKRAGIADFRWHDLRHTWASWHAQHGTPLFVLQEMGGWQSTAMVQRYAHLAPAHLASHAEALSAHVLDTILAHGPTENGGDAS